jgi:antitoxin YefM
MLETVTANEAKDEIQDLIKATTESHRPILITTESSSNGVLLAEEDWNALQETINLLSISGMRESIVGEMNKLDSEFLTEEEFFSALEKEEKH